MTSYSAIPPIAPSNVAGATYASSLAIQNSSGFAIKIKSITISLFASGVGASFYTTVTRYVGSGISGGNTFTAQPLRQGAQASGVTFRYRQITLTGSGSYTQGSAVTVTGTPQLVTSTNETDTTIQPPYDMILAPGSGLYIASCFANSTTTSTQWSGYSTLTVYYEELHLALSL